MSPTTRLLVGLLTGLAAGAALPSLGPTVAPRIVAVVEPFGTLWVNAVRMTVIPLVVSLLFVGIAGTHDPRALGRVGMRALLLCVAMLVTAAVFIALLAPPLLAALPLSPEASAALRAQASVDAAATGAPVGLAQWLTGLLPANPVKAAADGALLPLVFFSILFALAAMRIGPESRQALLGFFRGTSEAMLVLVRWVLALAPYGVFALALALASRLGLAAAGALAYYIGAVAVVCLTLIAAATVLAVVVGRVAPRAFLRAAAPAQAVAFSSRSSLAALPVLVEGGERLRFPTTLTAFFLPLAVATFRLGAVPAVVLGSLFLARLYGVVLAPTQVATIAVSAVLLSFSVPGVPGGSILVMAPVLASVGIPAAGMGILLAIDTAPDMFRTMTNVTGDIAAGAVLARRTADAAP